MQGSSSNGRAVVSKTIGWGFESLLPCQALAAAAARYFLAVAPYRCKTLVHPIQRITVPGGLRIARFLSGTPRLPARPDRKRSSHSNDI